MGKNDKNMCSHFGDVNFNFLKKSGSTRTDEEENEQ